MRRASQHLPDMGTERGSENKGQHILSVHYIVRGKGCIPFCMGVNVDVYERLSYPQCESNGPHILGLRLQCDPCCN